MDVETISAQQKDAGFRKKVRPTMQLYVPPAQRQRQQKKTEHKNKNQVAAAAPVKLSDGVKQEEVPLPVDGSASNNFNPEVQDAPSLVTLICNDEESEIISSKLQKDCVLSAPLSKDEVSRLNAPRFCFSNSKSESWLTSKLVMRYR